MKNKLILILIIIFLLVSFSLFKKSSSKNFYQFTINNKKYQLLTATNPWEWQKGLMNYKSKKELKGADGMIFIFPQKQMLTFWNKNTYLDLDVYWVDEEKIVGKSHLPSILKTKQIVTVSSPREVNKVVEIVIDNSDDK